MRICKICLCNLLMKLYLLNNNEFLNKMININHVLFVIKILILMIRYYVCNVLGNIFIIFNVLNNGFNIKIFVQFVKNIIKIKFRFLITLIIF